MPSDFASSHLLRRASPDQVCPEPFPHLVMENALEDEVYASLESQFPKDEWVRAAMHVAQRDQMQARDVLEHPAIAEEWKAFVRYHVSNAFYRDLVRLFGPWIRRQYPWLEEEMGHALEACTTGIRDPLAPCLPQVCLDCQPGLNVIHSTPLSVRTAHLDASNKILTGLFYMRLEEDVVPGGDLVLYRPRREPAPFRTPVAIDERDLEPVKTIPYRRNTAVFFMNTPRAIHGVTVRGGTPLPRRLVNLVAGLYTLPRKTLYPPPAIGEPRQAEHA
jgi:hypothetical protein